MGLDNSFNIIILIIFLIGYALITLEHITHINKAAVALMMAILCWVVQYANFTFTRTNSEHHFTEFLSSDTQVILFLLGALAIVETINVHKGFQLVTDLIQIGSKKQFLWLVAVITFFLSSVLDNLTTTVVMVSLIGKMISTKEERLLIGGAIVIAANAGGAWTPIGDVTTTMLWIKGQITSFPTIRDLFIPSLSCLIVATAFIGYYLKGEFVLKKPEEAESPPLSRTVFYLGIAALIFVPIFKIITGLPPFMGILFGLSVIWIVTDLAHRENRERESLCLPHVLSRIDLATVLFFLGILLCVNTLEVSGILSATAESLTTIFHNTHIAILIGIISAIVDNVPLVAASMGMYKIAEHPVDSSFWQLVAYCAGTGGSMLIIGSAAGVAFMSIEKVNFFWYLKRITLPAAMGYFAGIAIYLLLVHTHHE